MNSAPKTHPFLTCTVWVAGIGLLCRKIARFCVNKPRNILMKSLGFCRTLRKSPIADASRLAKGKQRSRMNNKLTSSQRRHLAAVKSMPCGVCGEPGPSDAHHIEQGFQYLCIPLCKDCHQGSFNGIHGQKRIWKVMKKTELSVLNDTIENLVR